MPNKLKQMRQKVRDELKNIPKGSAPQMEFRKEYWNRRLHSLGKKADMPKTPKEVLEESINALRGEYPDFKFEYDQEFFNKAD